MARKATNKKVVATKLAARRTTQRAAARAPSHAIAAKPAAPGRDFAPVPVAQHTAPPAGFRTIHVLSDSTGNLARHMMTAFTTQFPPDAFTVCSHNFLDGPAGVDAAFGHVAERPGIVVHAIVSPDTKRDVAGRAAALNLPCMDLTGAFVEFLSAASGVQPTPDRRRLHGVDAAYKRRIGAIEFTLAHDDGLGLETLGGADVVLAGVSRTSKSPTCIYLAQQGYRAGNVALAHGVDPPPELLRLPKGKVIGLYINPSTLSEIRSRRQTSWRMADTDYNRVDTVAREVEWSRQLFRRMGWETVDVTNQAIEETAGRIVERLGLGQPGAVEELR